jgi:hypothetical protein
MSLTCFGAFHRAAKVSTGKGTVEMADIIPGDTVLAYSPRLGSNGISFVYEKSIGANNGFMVEINVGNGKVIRAMPKQLLFDVNTQTFIQARKLTNKHVLLSEDSSLINVEGIKIKRRKSFSVPHEISVGDDHTLFVDGVLNHNVFPSIAAAASYFGWGAAAAGSKKYVYDPMFESMDRRGEQVRLERERGPEIVNSGRPYVDINEGLPLPNHAPMPPHYIPATPENSVHLTIRKNGVAVPSVDFSPASAPTAADLNSPFNRFSNPNDNPHSFGMGRGGKRANNYQPMHKGYIEPGFGGYRQEQQINPYADREAPQVFQREDENIQRWINEGKVELCGPGVVKQRPSEVKPEVVSLKAKRKVTITRVQRQNQVADPVVDRMMGLQKHMPATFPVEEPVVSKHVPTPEIVALQKYQVAIPVMTHAHMKAAQNNRERRVQEAEERAAERARRSESKRKHDEQMRSEHCQKGESARKERATERAVETVNNKSK